MNIYKKLNITPEMGKWEIRSAVEGYISGYFEGDLDHRFQNIENPLSTDRYINALLMLQPYSDGLSIQGSDHDIIYLGADLIKMAQSVDDDFLINLHRSGVYYSDEHDCFIMYT